MSYITVKVRRTDRSAPADQTEGRFVVYCRVPSAWGGRSPIPTDRPTPNSRAGAAMRVYECATCGEQHKMLILAMECCDPAAHDDED